MWISHHECLILLRLICAKDTGVCYREKLNRGAATGFNSSFSIDAHVGAISSKNLSLTIHQLWFRNSFRLQEDTSQFAEAAEAWPR